MVWNLDQGSGLEFILFASVKDTNFAGRHPWGALREDQGHHPGAEWGHNLGPVQGETLIRAPNDPPGIRESDVIPRACHKSSSKAACHWNYRFFVRFFLQLAEKNIICRRNKCGFYKIRKDWKLAHQVVKRNLQRVYLMYTCP